MTAGLRRKGKLIASNLIGLNRANCVAVSNLGKPRTGTAKETSLGLA
jgi:hypothetical protein